MTVYRDIYDKIRSSCPAQNGPRGRVYRILKLQEEAGEVAAGLIGLMGVNKRKGVTHDGEDVARELADVVITAMVAMHDWVPSPETYLKEQLQGLLERIKEEGS